jgi:hypothetical protein
VTEPAPQAPFSDLRPAAETVPDPDCRHLYAEIEDEDRDEFARRLSRMLDMFERFSIEPIHLSTAVISGAYGRPTRVAQIVVRMHRRAIAQFEDGSTDHVSDQAIVDRMMDFQISAGKAEPA